jgi:hypothetical protein
MPLKNATTTATPTPARGTGPEVTARCLSCEYDLGGLPLQGLCPECFLPIEFSRGGFCLAHASPAYVARLHWGTKVVLAGLLGMAAYATVFYLMPLPQLLNPSTNEIVDADSLRRHLCGLGVSLLHAIGWWLLSTPDPTLPGTLDGSRERRLLRVSVIATVCANALRSAFEIATDTTMGDAVMHARSIFTPELLAHGAAHIAPAVQFLAVMLYVRWLAARIPDASAYRRAGALMWVGPAACLLLCGLGWLLSNVLCFVLINRVRTDLRRLRLEQQGALTAA